MAVMRVEKNSNYTVMANHHLRDKRLSLKAKGLLSVMISLPAEWDYTLAGLAYISKEGVSAIRAAIQELEENGYVTRARLRNEAGQLGDTEYTIYEFPQNEEKAAEPSSPPQAPVSALADVSENVEPVCGNPILEKPILENPTLENPMLGFPTLGKSTSENRMQLNRDISNTYPKKKKEKNTDASNPNQSNIHPSIPEATESAAQTTWMNDEFIVDDPILEEPTTVSPLRREADSLTEQQKFLSEPTSIPGMRRRLSFDGLVKKIKDQINYWDLIENENRDEIDNIVSIMVEVMSTKCEYFTISGIRRCFDSDGELMAILNSQAKQMTIGGGVAIDNPEAVAEIKQYLELQKMKMLPTSMGDIHRRFSAIPYGWREIDIAAAIVSLISVQKVTIQYGGSTIQPSDTHILEYLRRRNGDKTTVAQRVTPPTEVIEKARKILKELFNTMDVPSDEDTLIFYVISSFTTEKEKLQALLDNQYASNAYPDKSVVENGVKLCNELLSQKKDNLALLKKLIAMEDDFLDHNEDMADVLAFFKNQKNIFDSAVSLIAKMSTEQEYLQAEQDATNALAQIRTILNQSKPYKRTSASAVVVLRISGIRHCGWHRVHRSGDLLV